MKEFFSVIRSSRLFSGISEEELSDILSCLGAKKESFPKDKYYREMQVAPMALC